jgi:tRNA A37 N6-isopentenylltransferase MiaA
VLYLKSHALLRDGSPPTLAICYRQALDFLSEQSSTTFDVVRFRDFLDQFRAASRQLARSQLTWFRYDLQFTFVDVDTYDDLPSTFSSWASMSKAKWDEFRREHTYAEWQAQERKTMSTADAKNHRAYISEDTIFKRNMKPDAVLSLIAQHIQH